MTPELQARIDDWRSKCLAGTITPEELRSAIADLRLARGNNYTPPKPAKAPAAPKAPKAEKQGQDVGALLAAFLAPKKEG